MSLEQSIERLASAAERMASNAAVAEIIRQRDEWQQKYEAMKYDRDWYQNRASERYDKICHLERVERGLRSAIKRMKKVKP